LSQRPTCIERLQTPLTAVLYPDKRGLYVVRSAQKRRKAMTERIYTAKDYGSNGWGVTTDANGRFSQTLFWFYGSEG
jgi:hypothetical protein